MKFKIQTYYLSCYYLDIIFSDQDFHLNQEYISLACLVLASKFVENDANIPNLNKYITYSKLNIKVDDLKKFEIICLMKLEYNLDIKSSFENINYFLGNGIIFDDEDFFCLSYKEKVTSNDSPNVIKSTAPSNLSSEKSNSRKEINLTKSNLKDQNEYNVLLEDLYSLVKEILLIFIESN
jgi:hypothetical protein